MAALPPFPLSIATALAGKPEVHLSTFPLSCASHGLTVCHYQPARGARVYLVPKEVFQTIFIFAASSEHLSRPSNCGVCSSFCPVTIAVLEARSPREDLVFVPDPYNKTNYTLHSGSSLPRARHADGSARPIRVDFRPYDRLHTRSHGFAQQCRLARTSLPCPTGDDYTWSPSRVAPKVPTTSTPMPSSGTR